MIQSLLEKIVQNKDHHAKWLNSLSFLENCGARKISKSEHRSDVDIMVLKHAAEEHRHAFYLKKMISRVDENACLTYRDEELLGLYGTKHYLHKLDIFTSKYLSKNLNLSGNDLKYMAYLLVTYAIEVRADELYPIYQKVLKKAKSKVSVYNIIKEEEGHLEEMIVSLNKRLVGWEEHAKIIQEYEHQLFQVWIGAIQEEIETI